VLREISRVRQPITQLRVGFWVELSRENKVVEEYLTEIDQIVGSNLKKLETVPEKVKGLSVSGLGPDGEGIEEIEIDQNSPYWPNKKKSMLGYTAMSFGFTVYIRKDPIDPVLFDPLISTRPGYSDWIAMHIPYPYNKKNTFALNYNYKAKTIVLRGFTHYPERLLTNGEITSLQDLYGAQMFLDPLHSSDSVGEKENPLPREIVRSMKLRTLVFEFSSGRSIWIDGARLTKSKYKGGAGGSPVFSIIFPNDEKELLSLASKETS
jgi:hypothetical protein